MEDGSWVNMNTNQSSILQWGENHPSKSIYGRMVIKPEENNILIESQGTNIWTPVLCTSDEQKSYQNDTFVSAKYPFRLFVKILGMCSSSYYDYRFVFAMEDLCICIFVFVFCICICVGGPDASLAHCFKDPEDREARKP